MKVTCYLVVGSGGAVRTTKYAPALSQNEVAIRLDVNLSNKFFERFIPHAKLDVPDDFVLSPEIKVELVLPKDSDYAEVKLRGDGK